MVYGRRADAMGRGQEQVPASGGPSTAPPITAVGTDTVGVEGNAFEQERLGSLLSGEGGVASKDLVARLPQTPHDFIPSYWGANERGKMTFSVNEHPDSIEYDDKFTYAGHEVGHMFGLPDEYDDGGAGQEQVAAHQALIESAGTEEVIRGEDTSSIMSKGGDVLPAHLVTFWEVLGRMTAAHLAPSEWRL